MADFETILPFANVNNQVMTARWLNRVINNLSWCYQAAIYGASPFRIVKHVANASATTWETAWYGRYYHQHPTLHLVYDLLAGKTDTEDNAGVLNPHYSGNCDNDWGTQQASFQYDGINYDLQMQLSIKKGATWYVYYSGGWHAMPDATPTDHIAKSTPIPTAATNKYGQGIDADISGLGLTVGDVYDVRVQCRNCAVTVHRIYADGVIGQTYSLPASVADGVKLHYDQWNLYPSSLDYLKREVDAPRGPTWGVVNRMGNRGDSRSRRVWRSWVKHMGNTLKWRIKSSRTDAGYYVSVKYDGSTLDHFTYGSGGVTENTWETSHDLTGLGLTIGNWYEVQVIGVWGNDEAGTSGSGSGEVLMTLDYLFEVDGLPTVSLDTPQAVHGDYVRGSTLLAGHFAAAYMQSDFGVVKTAADRVIQMVCPDVSTDATWPGALYHANDLSLIRQRTMLMWAGTGLRE